MSYLSYLPLFLTLNISSLVLNGLTTAYIAKSFDISAHVFFIVFLDALIFTSCAAFSVAIDSLIFIEVFNTNEFYCSVVFFCTFSPHNLGAFFTMAVAVIRY